jgi:hypothetical protein
MNSRMLQGLVIAGLVGSSAFVAGVPMAHVQAASSAATQYPQGTLATAALVHAGPGQGGHAVATTRQKGALPIHAQTGPSAAAGHAPLATPAVARGTSTLLQNFDGVGSRDSAVTNFGLQFEPPDQGLCVGNGFVLEPVNSAYRVYRTNGSTVVGPFNVNDIFNVGAEEFTSDPRCYYDAVTNTWFALILFINSSSTVSQVDVAVSTSGDPTGFWTEYRFDTTDNGINGEPNHPGCPCLGDQPTIGTDQNNLYFTTNEFSLVGPQFNGAQIYAVAKADLVKAKAKVHFVHFDHLNIGGTKAASVQPALTTGASQAEYFLNSLDPNGTFDNRIGAWAMTNTAAVAAGHSPTLSSRIVSSEAYSLPPPAKQKGSSSRLDSGDDRMQQTQFINGTLWGALTTGVTIPNDATERAGAAWFAVHPTLDGSLIGTTTIVHQGYEAEAGHYLIYPAIQADSAGRAAMGFARTGSDVYPSAAYAVLQLHHSSFGAPVTAAAGTGPYDRHATRWGDYSFAVLDPSGTAFWLATEYMPPKSSQTVDGKRNWGTRVMEVCAC